MNRRKLKAMASALYAHTDFILAERMKGRNFTDIARKISEAHGTKVTPNALANFWHRYTVRMQKIRDELRPFRQIAQISPLVSAAAVSSAITPVTDQLQDQGERRGAILRRVAASRAASVAIDPEEEARQEKIEAAIANLPHNRILSENKTNKTSDEK